MNGDQTGQASPHPSNANANDPSNANDPNVDNTLTADLTMREDLEYSQGFQKKWRRIIYAERAQILAWNVLNFMKFDQRVDLARWLDSDGSRITALA
jgi:hypothetical protein